MHGECMLVRESISKLPAEKEFNNLTLNASEENRCGVIYGMFISWRDDVPTRLKNIYWHWRNGCHFCSFPACSSFRFMKCNNFCWAPCAALTRRQRGRLESLQG